MIEVICEKNYFYPICYTKLTHENNFINVYINISVLMFLADFYRSISHMFIMISEYNNVIQYLNIFYTKTVLHHYFFW